MKTKLIPIADGCLNGCRLPDFVAALEQIAKLAAALQRQPVQSRSVERRYGSLIESVAKKALQ